MAADLDAISVAPLLIRGAVGYRRIATSTGGTTISSAAKFGRDVKARSRSLVGVRVAIRPHHRIAHVR